jgi:hypothetical protein
MPRFALCLLPLLLGAAEVAAPPALDRDRPLVQVAILLDDSGSMNGLINQARAHLWDLVNQAVKLTHDGRRPRVEVALYHYGSVGFLSQPLLPFSDDLDEVSKQLFAIKGGGGEERCGEVIANATQQLSWSNQRSTLKLIYICGNEPFTQGPVDYRDACRAAIAKGIMVNTIHCGSDADGRSGMWADAARLADGSFANIDQNQAVVAIAAPQDARIAELNGLLNATYLCYGGGAGQAKFANQAAQDANALASGSFAKRAAAKSSAAYSNGSWDLVDAVTTKTVDLATLPKDQLPAELRLLDAAALAAAVAAKAKARAAVQAELASIAAERERFVAEAQRRQPAGNGQAATLGEALCRSLVEQAGKKGYQADGQTIRP